MILSQTYTEQKYLQYNTIALTENSYSGIYGPVIRRIKPVKESVFAILKPRQMRVTVLQMPHKSSVKQL